MSTPSVRLRAQRSNEGGSVPSAGFCWALAPTLRVVPYRNRHTAPVVPSGGFSSKLAPIPVRPPWLKGRHEAPPSQGRWTRSGRAGDARRGGRATREPGKDQTRRDEGEQRTTFAMPASPSDLGWRMDVTREEPATDDEGTDGRTENGWKRSSQPQPGNCQALRDA